MTDEEITHLLRSEAPIVVIEAPAGCGKTFQAASYAKYAASRIGNRKVLVLTHTHAACSVVAERTESIRNRLDIRTLDGLIFEIAAAYRESLTLPEDIAGWARTETDGYSKLAEIVAIFLCSNPMICRVLARRFPVIICDEHQDSSEDQEGIVMSLANHGSLLRVFGDPMQAIPGGSGQDEAVNQIWKRWKKLKATSQFGELETPHRWKESNPGLGRWILKARNSLKFGRPITVSECGEEGLHLLVAENNSPSSRGFVLAPENGDWRSINAEISEDKTTLCVAATSYTIEGLRSSFAPRLPIWEGHTRNNLESFVDSIAKADSAVAVGEKLVEFLKNVMTGFTSKYSSRLISEVNTVTEHPRGAIPPVMKELAMAIRDAPGHIGCSHAARKLRQLIKDQMDPFSRIRIDLPWELHDLIKLGDFHDAQEGLAEIAFRRSRAHPKPPRKCLSTIHKCKGLESETAVIFGLDKRHFPDNRAKRNLLYVAMSRATSRLVIVHSKTEQSPLIQV